MRASTRRVLASRAIGFSLVGTLALLLVAGCTFGRLQVGHPLDASAKARLHPGQPKAEVLELLGPPDRVTMIWQEASFEYLYREDLSRQLDLSLFQASFDYDRFWSRADRLVVRFDPDGRVRDFGVNLQTGASPDASSSSEYPQDDRSRQEPNDP